MAALEIREHTIDSTATVFFFARVYEDDRASAAAYDRARAKIGARLHEVAHANALHSTASWTGVGGLALGPTGSRGTMRRPHG